MLKLSKNISQIKLNYLKTKTEIEKLIHVLLDANKKCLKKSFELVKIKVRKTI